MSSFALPFIYKKTLAGQREYKRSIPRFIAVSEYGICVKWNADVSPSEFINNAYWKLIEYVESGCEWDICVLYKHDPSRFERGKVFFKISFTDIDYINWNASRLETLDILRKLRKSFADLKAMVKCKQVTTQQQYCNELELLLQEI